MDQVRSEQSRRNREDLIAAATPQSELLGPPADAEPADRDDSLALLFGCCHPALSSPSQIALTLRAVGGLSTAQIAAAFGVPEATMAQRISRAKQTIIQAGADFSIPAAAERTERLQAVLHVLYLIFSEGYTHQRRGGADGARRCRGRRSGSPAGCAGCCPRTARWPACWR